MQQHIAIMIQFNDILKAS